MRSALLALVLSICAACSPVDAPVRCTPNGQNACVCSSGRTGTQTCEAGGASYTACACAEEPGDVLAEDAADAPADAGTPEDRLAPVDVAPAVDAVDVVPAVDVVDAQPVDTVQPVDVHDAGTCLGADVQNDPLNCGSCGNVCPVYPHTIAQCLMGGCSARCMPPFQGCDSSFANGCETDLSSDRRNCGRCRNECSPSQTCRDGVCR